jgi:hypothetical protein
MINLAIAQYIIQHHSHNAKEIAMLALEDTRWCLLTTFFQNPSKLPRIIHEWQQAFGHEQEARIYLSLHGSFLHQATITNAAFAVVPWLIEACKQGEMAYIIEYLADIALIEANRLTHGLAFHRPDTEEYPDWLMEDYQAAVLEARALSDQVLARYHQHVEMILNAGDDIYDLLDAHPEFESLVDLVKLQPALYGNGELAWQQWLGD